MHYIFYDVIFLNDHRFNFLQWKIEKYLLFKQEYLILLNYLLLILFLPLNHCLFLFSLLDFQYLKPQFYLLNPLFGQRMSFCLPHHSYQAHLKGYLLIFLAFNSLKLEKRCPQKVVNFISLKTLTKSKLKLEIGNQIEIVPERSGQKLVTLS